jgi:hypothetical protein
MLTANRSSRWPFSAIDICSGNLPLIATKPVNHGDGKKTQMALITQIKTDCALSP